MVRAQGEVVFCVCVYQASCCIHCTCFIHVHVHRKQSAIRMEVCRAVCMGMASTRVYVNKVAIIVHVGGFAHKICTIIVIQ